MLHKKFSAGVLRWNKAYI